VSPSVILKVIILLEWNIAMSAVSGALLFRLSTEAHKSITDAEQIVGMDLAQIHLSPAQTVKCPAQATRPRLAVDPAA
jgi:hypothetical protein